MILPIVNNNGTSRNELIEQRRHVLDGLRATTDALRQMAPHGRDFQTDLTGEQFKLARKQHEQRVKLLTDLHNEIRDEAIALCNYK